MKPICFLNQDKIPFLEFEKEMPIKSGGKKTIKIVSPLGSPEANHAINDYYKSSFNKYLSLRELTQKNNEALYEAYKNLPREVYGRFFKKDERYYVSKDRFGNHLVEIDSEGVKNTSADKIGVNVYLSQQSQNIKASKIKVELKPAVKEFKELFGLTWSQTILIISYLIDVIRSDTPKLGLLITGPEGSGKSVLAEFLVLLLDPSDDAINHLSGRAEDIIALANSKAILGYDNLSKLSTKIQDLICILSTGGSFPSRKLFTNHELSSVYLKRATIFTGISIPGIQSDFAERMLKIDLTDTSRPRLAASKLAEKTKALRPRLFSAICHLFSHSLTELPSVIIENPARMADYEEIGTIVAQLMNLKMNFSSVYQKNLSSGAQDAVDNQPAVRLSTLLVTSDSPFEGTYGELLIALREINTSREPLPSTEKALSEILKRHEKALNKLGYVIGRPGRNKHGQVIQISYTR
jgi:hypothetical protein